MPRTPDIEPPQGYSGTVETLHELMQVQFIAIRTLLDERHLAREKATLASFTAMQVAMDKYEHEQQVAMAKAETAADRRFESVNEFRGQLADQAASFIPRLEVQALMVAMQSKLEAIEKRFERDEGRVSGASATVGFVMSIIGAVGVVVSIVTALIVLTKH